MKLKKGFLLLVVLLGFLKVTAQFCPGRSDKILNITFGAGPNPGPPFSGVTQNYTYSDHDCPLDNYYAIRNNTTLCYGGSWHSLASDHTGDPNGYFMIVDASFTPGGVFIDTAKSLCANNYYEYGIWIMNIDGPRQSCVDRGATFPDITLKVEKTDGTTIGVYNIGRIPITNTAQWQKYSVFFTAPPGVSDVVIKLFNNTPGGCGNDFALDDITLRHCETQVLTFLGEDPTSAVKELVEGKAASVTFSCKLFSNNVNSDIKWQESKDRGKTWKDIPGANSTSFVKHFPATTPLGYYLYRAAGTEELRTDSLPCRITSNVLTVRIIKDLFIPNAFSPNGDGINDTWAIQAIRALSGYELTVYDRRGMMVFHTYNYRNQWDGTFNGKALPLGTYYYLIDFKDGLPKEKGYVVLVK